MNNDEQEIFQKIMDGAADFQKQMEKTQEDLAKLEAAGQDKDKMVKVVITGGHRIKELNINDQIMKNKQILQQSIIAAFNNAVENIEAEALNGLLEKDLMPNLRKIMQKEENKA